MNPPYNTREDENQFFEPSLDDLKKFVEGQINQKQISFAHKNLNDSSFSMLVNSLLQHNLSENQALSISQISATLSPFNNDVSKIENNAETIAGSDKPKDDLTKILVSMDNNLRNSNTILQFLTLMSLDQQERMKKVEDTQDPNKESISDHENYIKNLSKIQESVCCHTLLEKVSEFSKYTLSDVKYLNLKDMRQLECDVILVSPDKDVIVFCEAKNDATKIEVAIDQLLRRQQVVQLENQKYIEDQNCELLNPQLTKTKSGLKIHLAVGTNYITDAEKQHCRNNGIMVVTKDNGKIYTVLRLDKE